MNTRYFTIILGQEYVQLPISYIHIYSYIMKSTSEHAEVNASSLIALHPGIGTIRIRLLFHNAKCEKVVSGMDCVSGSITLETQ